MSTSATVDEATPLLTAVREEKRTPLPKLQIAIVIFLQIGEPLTSQSIYPYINQLIRELDITGGDDRKVGYYAGLIESIFFATEAMTVLYWSRLSDRIGRKPVLLLGLLGSMISILCFGLSRTLRGLIMSRCLTGLLNGNIGVMKSIMGDLTNPTNRAEAFALLSLTWTIGCTVGPIIGGSLSHPHERFPTMFPVYFWKGYPYFLPCLVVGCFLFSAFLVTLCFLKETVKKIPHRKGRVSPADSNDIVSTSNAVVGNKSVPLRDLMVYPVLLSLSNYAALAFLNLCIYALLPLFLTMPIDIGGLGLQPPTIGMILGIYGIVSGAVQVVVFARVIKYFGARNTFVFSMFSYIPAFLLFPVISLVAKTYAVHAPVWVLILLMLLFLGATDMGYGTIFMFITASAPSKRSLGATNGLSQMAVSTSRALGPALATSMFSLSVERNILGGYGVFFLLAFVSLFATYWASRLPSEIWKESDDEVEH